MAKKKPVSAAPSKKPPAAVAKPKAGTAKKSASAARTKPKAGTAKKSASAATAKPKAATAKKSASPAKAKPKAQAAAKPQRGKGGKGGGGVVPLTALSVTIVSPGSGDTVTRPFPVKCSVAGGVNSVNVTIARGMFSKPATLVDGLYVATITTDDISATPGGGMPDSLGANGSDGTQQALADPVQITIQ